jgi:hypothetical protein
MWRDPLEELIQALEKVVDVPVTNDSETSVEYLERCYAQWQIETDIVLFITPDQIARLNRNGADE